MTTKSSDAKKTIRKKSVATATRSTKRALSATKKKTGKRTVKKSTAKEKATKNVAKKNTNSSTVTKKSIKHTVDTTTKRRGRPKGSKNKVKKSTHRKTATTAPRATVPVLETSNHSPRKRATNTNSVALHAMAQTEIAAWHLWFLLLFLVGFVLVVMFAATTGKVAVVDASVDSFHSSCKDLDRGNNWYTASSVQTPAGEVVDYCRTSYELREAYCDQGEVKYVAKKCDCQDGACTLVLPH